MAWIDNRAWSHPKVVGLSDQAFRVWVNGICYSSGFGTQGRLGAAHQKLVGSTPKIRRELENAGLWLDEGPDVLIHDWDEHNGERDRKAENRKRYMREYQAERRRQHPSYPQAVNVDVNVDTGVDITPLTGDKVTGEGIQTKKDVFELAGNLETHLGQAI